MVKNPLVNDWVQIQIILEEDRATGILPPTWIILEEDRPTGILPPTWIILEEDRATGILLCKKNQSEQ